MVAWQVVTDFFRDRHEKYTGDGVADESGNDLLNAVQYYRAREMKQISRTRTIGERRKTTLVNE